MNTCSPVLMQRLFRDFCWKPNFPCWNNFFLFLSLNPLKKKKKIKGLFCTKSNTCGFTKNKVKFCSSKNLRQREKFVIMGVSMQKVKCSKGTYGLSFQTSQPFYSPVPMMSLVLSPSHSVTGLAFLCPFLLSKYSQHPRYLNRFLIVSYSSLRWLYPLCCHVPFI